MDRRDFIKTVTTAGTVAILGHQAFSENFQEKTQRTELKKTSEQFKNGEFVYEFVNEKGERMGEFWPVHGLNLVSRDIFPKAFEGEIGDIQKKLGDKNIVATAPDGMTGGSVGARKMEGKSLSNGIPCGDGIVKNYGIVVVEKKGYSIKFTHALEHTNDFDSFYSSVKDSGNTLFFLPSIYRNGKFLSSDKVVEKVLVRRNVPVTTSTPKGEQIGVFIFSPMLTYDQARKAILGLDRPDKPSETTHIYMLDGGPVWGQSCKEVNGKVEVIGTRDPKEVTNYLVFY